MANRKTTCAELQQQVKFDIVELVIHLGTFWMSFFCFQICSVEGKINVRVNICYHSGFLWLWKTRPSLLETCPVGSSKVHNCLTFTLKWHLFALFFKALKPSNHATIQSIVRAVGVIPGIPEPCCVPEKMSSLSILFFDEDKNVVLKVYPNMTVDSCACR